MAVAVAVVVLASVSVDETELVTALRDGRCEEFGWRIRKDGSQFWANVVITPLKDDSGRHTGFVKVTW